MSNPTSNSRVVRLVSGDEVTIPAALLDGDGEDAPRFVGMTDGYVVVEAHGMRYGLTPCCGASATGSMVDDVPAIVCRSCYEEVDPFLGAPMEVHPDNAWMPDEDTLDPESLDLLLGASGEVVQRLRRDALVCEWDGATAAAARLRARAARLAEAIDNMRAHS